MTVVPSAGDLDPPSTSPVRPIQWLVLAPRRDAVDRYLMPGIVTRVDTRPASFLTALRTERPRLVVIHCPPGGPVEIGQVAIERQQRPDLRAILLSGHDAVATRLRALEMGFDDAIDLDADPLEVSGRLAIGGRDNRDSSRIRVAAGIEVDLRAKVLMRDGTPIHLRPREFELLEFLVTHPGEAFSRDELRRFALPPDAKEATRAIDVHVFMLRSKIEPDPGTPRHIVTVPRVGYRFDPPAVTDR